MTLTDADLAAIRGRVEKATEGPWEAWNGCSWWRIGQGGRQHLRPVIEPTNDASDGHPNLTGPNLKDDLEFACHARTDIPALLAEVTRLRAENEWRDISTAPRDGTRLWLYFPGRAADDRQAVGWYDTRIDFAGFIDHADSSWTDDQPTHWRPLPAPAQGGE